jgi:uncharacterized membrane protein
MYKIVKIALIVIGLLGTVLWFMLPEGNMPPAEAAQSGSMNAMFLLTFLLFGIAILFSVVFSLKAQFSNPNALKKSLYGVGGLVLVIIISYVLATGSDVNLEEMSNRGIQTTEGTVRTIGMGLNIFFILTIIALVLMILPSVKKVFTKS